MSKELKPCPLCGGKAKASFDGDYYAPCDFLIECESCDLHLYCDGIVKGKDNIEIAEKYIEIWNKRPEDRFTYRFRSNQYGRRAEKATIILEELLIGRLVRYVSKDGIWDLSSKKLPKPEPLKVDQIWFDEEGRNYLNQKS